MKITRQAHLVGSVGLPDAEKVFTIVSEILGPRCPRIPDGETGARSYFIQPWPHSLEYYNCNPIPEI